MKLILAIGLASLLAPLALSAQQRELSRLDLDPRLQVTMQFQDVPLSEALDLLAHEAHIQIQVAADADVSRTIRAGFVRARVADIVEFLLKQAKLAYTVLDAKTLLVSAGPDSRPPSPSADLTTAGIWLRLEVYRNGSPVTNAVVAVAADTAAIVNIGNGSRLPLTAARIDAEHTAVAFEITSDEQDLKPRLLLRNQEPGTVSWRSFELRVVSLR